MKQFTAKLFDFNKYDLAESPFYTREYRRYSWVDIPKGELWTMQYGVKNRFSLGQPIGAAVPLADKNGFVLAAKDGLYTYENGSATLLYPLDKIFRPYWRCNDAKADPLGRIWFGASVADDDHEPEGALFCYDRGVVKCMQENTKIANGMAWSYFQTKFYFADSLEHAVFQYDYDLETGEISNRTVLFTVENGVPDGMCIDADDNLWLAIWGGKRIEKRSTANGKKLAEISVPAEHVTSCYFGEQKNTLFITTSGMGLNGMEDGLLYTCEVDGAAPVSYYARTI